MILVICRTPHLRNICGFLIVNLAVADFIASAFAIPIFFYALSHTKHCFGSHNTLILVGIGLSLISVAASIGTLVSLSVDRSFAICCPLKHKTFMTFTKLKVKIVSIWLACTTLLIWCVVRLGAAEDVHLISSLFILCFLIIITSGVVTLLHVRKNSSRVSKLHQNQGGSQFSVTMRQRNQQVAKTVGIVVMFFCLSWSPFVVLRMSNPLDYSQNLSFWFNSLGLANSAMNPCIYFYRHRNYREALKATFHCR